jgi:hypothetical protein
MGSLPLIIAALTATLPAGAHEMFLKPQGFVLEANSTAFAELVNGTFEASENVIDRDRMVDVSVRGPDGVRHPSEDQWSEEGLSTVLRYGTGAPGTYALAVSTKPRLITLSAQSIEDYLAHEGVEDALLAYRQAEAKTGIRERYSKHVRSIVQVGGRTSPDHREPLGYPVEIILEDNP